MRAIFLIILLPIFQGLYAQTTYAKILDFGHTPQYADQLVAYKGQYYMAYTQVCVNEEGNLKESCGGVIKIDDQANILDSNLVRRYSDNPECIVIDSVKEVLYLTGEEYFEQDYSYEYMVNTFSLSDFKTIKQDFYKYPSLDQINYFQFGSVLWNDRLIINGSSRSVLDNDIKTLMFSIDENTINTSLLVDLGLGTVTYSTYLDNNNALTLHIFNTLEEGNKSIILKLDSNFKEVWRWESPKLGQQTPHGCQLTDGRTVVAMHTSGFSNIGSVWCINEDKSVSWKFEFPEKNGGQERRIFRLKQLKNDDIIGVGHYGDLKNDNPDYQQIPFMFRLTEEGQLKWLKAFYRDVTLPNGYIAPGNFADVVETENGDLLAVGKIGDWLTYDPIIDGARPDNDILIVRTDANGCIDETCATVTKIDETVDVDTPPALVEMVLLYPNPTHENLELLHYENVASIVFYNMLGSQVHKINDITSQISVAGLHGSYIAKITMKNGHTLQQKIIIH